ncbi:MAG TPA: AAA family ATPase [Xanthomonadaceae bacterium]|nr:AAA family ATPase [Xanthomonadaceae bacterium]
MNAGAANAYLAGLGLSRSPFPPTPDADAYFHTAALQRDLAEAAHCLLARKGFVLLTGEVGTGKSTFVRKLLDEVTGQGAIASLVFNTFLQGDELLAAVLRDFGIKPGTGAADNIDRLNTFLVRRWEAGSTCVLVIDDAQNLGLDSLELLRLLSNLESGQEKLLQIVLAGQPELEAQLGRHEIRQLTSRIVKHIRMPALDSGDCARYVEFRLALAGAAGRIRMTPRAHAAVFRDSAGNPRRIHLIMDRCLYGVLASGDPVIDAGLVRTAAAEAGFSRARRRRRAPFAAIALLAATGIAAAAGFAWHAATPAAPATAPPVAVTHVATRQATPADPLDACLARQGAGGAREDGGLQVLAVPEAQLAFLRERGDVCLARRGDGSVAAWRPHWRVERLIAGERSDEVRALQSALAALGAFPRDLPADAESADGLFGPRTRAALMTFQQRHGLAASGRCDPLTLLLLPRPADATPTETAHGRHG